MTAKTHRGLFFATVALVAAIALAFSSQRRWGDNARADISDQSSGMESSEAENEQVSIAFVGNSIIYYNDTPRFLAYLRNAAAPSGVTFQNSCLRGGANFVSILTDGNGMLTKFGTPNALKSDGSHDIGAPTVEALLIANGSDNETPTTPATVPKWDFVVMNDYTQAPAREDLRRASKDALVRDYVPMFLSSGARPVFLVTVAYREPVNDSEDLGGVEAFTSKVLGGYEEYAAALEKLLPASQRPVVAPVGLAFLHVYHENRDMWKKLFHTDHFHPSPHGSYLQSCVLYRSIFGEVPPKEIAVPADKDGGGPGGLWDQAKARMMQPAGTPPLQRPTAQEASYLREVAERVCSSYFNSSR